MRSMTVHRHSEWRPQFVRILRLGGPLVVNNLAVAGMGFADAVMAGRLGAESLAAVAVGSSLWFLAFTLGLGIQMAISPIAARLWGARNYHLIGSYTRQGLYFALAFGLVVIVVGRAIGASVLTKIGIDPGFRHLTVSYFEAIIWGAPGILMFLALRFTTEGIGHLRPIMFTSILGLASNVFLNYTLMFGHFGAPALGVAGCGYASAISMWIVMLALGAYIVLNPRYRPLGIFTKLAPPRLGILREIVVLGLPIAIMVTAEAGLFNAISILVGTLGANITAAHQIAINFSSTLFMVPLALSSATTVQVGQLLGAGDRRLARIAGTTGIITCAAFMTLSAVSLLLFRDSVVSLYTDDAAVREIAISLLLIAAIFQVADGIQIGAASALRGYKDTRVPMAINIFAFWVVAFPLAYLAAVTFKAPPNYIWAAFVAGLGLAAILLSWRYARLSRV